MICGAQAMAIAMKTKVQMRPMRAVCSGVRWGRLGLMKSSVTNVDAEFSVESTDDMMAAINPAITSPTAPTGSSSVTMVGNT